MKTHSFSRTAIATAALRAQHQTIDGARIFFDPLAPCALTPEDGEAIKRAGEPALRPLRLFVALRSQIAEEIVRRAIGEGVRQVVILGAGLDTFAHRATPQPDLRIFEIDHPATQSEKRRRFAANGIDPPAHLIYAPCDFESQSLPEALAGAGFDAQARTAFIWLGVVPYLTAAAVETTLSFIAERSGGADVVFDYSNPVGAEADQATKRRRDAMAARVAQAGEPFLSFFETPDLHRRLAALGFDEIEDWGPRARADRFGGKPHAHDRGGHILHAAVADLNLDGRPPHKRRLCGH